MKCISYSPEALSLEFDCDSLKRMLTFEEKKLEDKQNKEQNNPLAKPVQSYKVEPPIDQRSSVGQRSPVGRSSIPKVSTPSSPKVQTPKHHIPKGGHRHRNSAYASTGFASMIDPNYSFNSEKSEHSKLDIDLTSGKEHMESMFMRKIIEAASMMTEQKIKTEGEEKKNEDPVFISVKCGAKFTILQDGNQSESSRVILIE